MTSLIRALVALCLGPALAILLAIGTIVHGGASTQSGPGGPGQPNGSPPATPYVLAVNAALQRYDVARSKGDRLLTERDVDPRLVDSVVWRLSFGEVIQEHQLVHDLVQSLRAPPGAGATQQCLVDGLRLTALGEGLLLEAFGADGHQAYYLSAHGNWDLNLGVRDVARCRVSLTLAR